MQKQRTERKRELDVDMDVNDRDVDFDTPVQAPKLDRVRKGSSHRKTQARQQIISDKIINKSDENPFDDARADIVGSKAMNSTILEDLETPTARSSATMQAAAAQANQAI